MFLVLSIMCFWPSTKRRINVNLRLYILSYKVALSFVGYIGIICILYWINLHQLSYHLSLLIRVRINLGQQTSQSCFIIKLREASIDVLKDLCHLGLSSSSWKPMQSQWCARLADLRFQYSRNVTAENIWRIHKSTF